VDDLSSVYIALLIGSVNKSARATADNVNKGALDWSTLSLLSGLDSRSPELPCSKAKAYILNH
jgi:hypothetical protein